LKFDELCTKGFDLNRFDRKNGYCRIAFSCKIAKSFQLQNATYFKKCIQMISKDGAFFFKLSILKRNDLTVLILISILLQRKSHPQVAPLSNAG